MKIFVAGATGVVGRRLVPMLIESGHDVVGLARSTRSAALVAELGAEPVMGDALDPEAVGRAVSASEPEVVIHQATALSDGALSEMRNFDRAFANTNRLRTEGTDNLLSAARAAGARRFIAQSFAGWPYERRGSMLKTEEDPLDPNPIGPMAGTINAIRRLEETVTGASGIEGVVLRYGLFYGPGTSVSLDPPGEHIQAVRDRKFPIVGSGAGMFSPIHIDDVAAATVAAVERGAPGIYNIVDDDPAPFAEVIPAMAEVAGAKPPMHIPRWLARLVAGKAVVVMMTEARGARNDKAKRELGWQPRYSSWREGFRVGLTDSAGDSVEVSA